MQRRSIVAAFCAAAARIALAVRRRGARVPGADPRRAIRAPIPAGRSPGHRRASATAAASSARGSPTCCSTCSARRAWWLVAAGVVLIVNGYRRIADPETRDDHPLLLGIDRLRAGAAVASSAIEAIALVALAVAAAGRARRRDRRSHRRVARRARSGSTARRLLLLAVFAVGFSLFTGVSWLRLMERIGERVDGRDRAGCTRGARSARIAASATQARLERDELIDAHARGGGVARADRRRAAGRAGAAVGARRQGEAAAALHRHAGLAAAAALAARGRAAVAGDGQRRDARIHLAPDRAQARRLRRAGRGCSRRIRAR